MIEKLKLYFQSLQDRERYLIIFLVYGIIFLGGFFLAVPYFFSSSNRQKEILKQKVEQFYQFKSLIAVYSPKTLSRKHLTLSDISRIAVDTGIKSYILSIKPVENGFEIRIDNAEKVVFSSFLKGLKKEKTNIDAVHINLITGKVKGTVVVSGEDA